MNDAAGVIEGNGRDGEKMRQNIRKFFKKYGFDIEITQTRTLPYKNQFWNAITYELSLTREKYTRTVYGFFDFLRDLGGLFSAISPIFGVTVSIL